MANKTNDSTVKEYYVVDPFCGDPCIYMHICVYDDIGIVWTNVQNPYCPRPIILDERGVWDALNLWGYCWNEFI